MSPAVKPEWSSQLPPLKSIGRLQLDRPLVCFDLETTGLSKVNDRIVEFGAVKVFPNGRIRLFRWLINPGTPIPPRASAKHKIRDEDVIGHDMFIGKADSIMEVFKGCDILGYNSMTFDVPFLHHEFRRVETTTGRSFQFPPEGARQIDAMKIFKAFEPGSKSSRQGGPSESYSGASGSVITGGDDVYDTADSSQYARPSYIEQNYVPQCTAPCNHKLSTALMFYTGMELVNAHTALADADATLRVLLGQLEWYSEVELPSTVQGLHDLCSCRQSSATRTPSRRNQSQSGEASSSYVAPLQISNPRKSRKPKSSASDARIPTRPETSSFPAWGEVGDLSSALGGLGISEDHRYPAGALEWGAQRDPYVRMGNRRVFACGVEETQPEEEYVWPNAVQEPRETNPYVRWHNSKPILTFGKYKGATFEYVALSDYDYLLWMQSRCFPEMVHQIVDSYLDGFRQ